MMISLTQLRFLPTKLATKMKKYLMVQLIILFSIFNITNCYAAVSVGDSYGGGTVFCVSQTPDITQCVPQGSGNYGLIMANEDQANFDSNPENGVTWASSKRDAVPGALSDDDGAANTAAIMAAHPQDNPGNNAAWLCHNYRDPEGHTDWYLPSKNELNKMYLFAKTNNLIGKGCAGSKVGGVQCLIGGGQSSYKNKLYWSSTEYSGSYYSAWDQVFNGGYQGNGNKDTNWFGARAVRAFNNSTIKPFIPLPEPKGPTGVAIGAATAHVPTVTAAAVAPATTGKASWFKSLTSAAPAAPPVPIATPSVTTTPTAIAHVPTVTAAAVAPATTGTGRFTLGAAGERLTRLGNLTRLYPPRYQPPSLVRGMTDAGVPTPEEVSGICDTAAACAISDGTVNCTRLTQEDIATIAMYTFDFGDGNRDRNPYRLINTGLFERNTLQLNRLKGLIYRLLHALRSVSPAQPHALFRGIRERVKLDDAHYHKGNKIVWHTFSSTTTDMGITQNFLTDPATGMCEGTLFIITGTPWGYNIQPFSCFPDEEEILLEPEIELRVTGVVNPPTGLTVVNLEMLPDQRLLLESLIPRGVSAAAGPASPTATVLPLIPVQDEVWYIAKFDWESDTAGELSFKKGDAIKIIDKEDGDWWLGELKNGKKGLVPKKYLKPFSPAPQSS